MSRIAPIVAASSIAAVLVAPAGAGAEVQPSTASVDPVPPCVRTVIDNAPGFVLGTVQNAQQGELPRIMGPFLPC
jgi:hypothetical protein